MGMISAFVQETFCRGTSSRKDDMRSHTHGVAGKPEGFVLRDDQTIVGGDACITHFPAVLIECGGEIQQLAAG